MENNKYKNQFVIAKGINVPTEEGYSVAREILVRIPARTGIYETEHGEIEVTVCKPSQKDNTRKVIFAGAIIAEEGKRRVVVFPASPKKEVKQPIGPEEFLIFSQKQGKQRSRK